MKTEQKKNSLVKWIFYGLLIGGLVAIKFRKGGIYTAKEVKEILQEVYDELGLNVRAKATDLPNYISCTKGHTKTGDIYRID